MVADHQGRKHQAGVTLRYSVTPVPQILHGARDEVIEQGLLRLLTAGFGTNCALLHVRYNARFRSLSGSHRTAVSVMMESK
jgi:hypothetical protein